MVRSLTHHRSGGRSFYVLFGFRRVKIRTIWIWVHIVRSLTLSQFKWYVLWPIVFQMACKVDVPHQSLQSHMRQNYVLFGWIRAKLRTIWIGLGQITYYLNMYRPHSLSPQDGRGKRGLVGRGQSTQPAQPARSAHTHGQCWEGWVRVGQTTYHLENHQKPVWNQ